MKTKITILLMLLALTLTGCSDNRTPEQKQEAIDAGIAAHIVEFNYKGHRYLKYNNEQGNWSVGGITHDPDCPCHKNTESHD